MRPETYTAHEGIYHGYRAAEGDAPTLVFSNSLGTDLRVWDRVVARLPQSWGILRQDKRGHGLSAARAGLSIETLADDVETLLDHYGIARFVGVGLSVGGLVMQRLALRRAGAMTHLILSDTAAKIGTPEIWNPRIETVRRDGLPAIGKAILERWFAPEYRSQPDFEMWRMMLERTPAEGYAQVCEAIRDADYRDALGDIAQPTLAIAGAQDCSTTPEIVKATADAIPNAHYEEIDAAGHLPCVEQPDRFTALLRRHLGA